MENPCLHASPCRNFSYSHDLNVEALFLDDYLKPNVCLQIPILLERYTASENTEMLLQK